MPYSYRDTGQRAEVLAAATKIVVKVGTRLLTDMGSVAKAERVRQLITAIAAARARGLDVLLVSSGAIGAGMQVLATAKRPRSLSQLQAHAAVGQSWLMFEYENACVAEGFHCAQLLLTAADVQNRDRHLNVTACLDALLARKVLPIINENDSVSVDEIRFGDNDILAGLVATMVRADLTLLLTTVDGMHERDAGGTPGPRLSVIDQIDSAIVSMASGTDGNRFSVGGMASKLEASDLVTKAGESLWIADGSDFSVIADVLDGLDVGTLLPAPEGGKMRARKRYLAFFAEHAGEVKVDGGAVRALRRQGRSLLPSGIIDATGEFRQDDIVRIIGPDGGEVARGVSNYSCDDVLKIKGRNSSEIGCILKCGVYHEEVVHRTHLALT